MAGESPLAVHVERQRAGQRNRTAGLWHQRRWRRQGPNHNGGPIAFGPDGKLYGITGDLNRNEAEQNYQAQANNSSQVGGIYRLNDDGTVPGDNPFSGHSNADFHRWFAYGIRNSFGLTFDPATGNLWDTENGPGSYDEVNLVAPGFNSGWEQTSWARTSETRKESAIS